jgi:hypothetical protein
MKHYKAPRALVCGMLERDGKALFLKKRGADGVERIEMPWVFGTLAADPVGAMAEAFRKQTGVKVKAGGIAIEGKEDIGDEGRPDVVPVLVLRMIQAREEGPEPASGFSGFEWLDLAEAARKAPGRHARWLSGEWIRVD